MAIEDGLRAPLDEARPAPAAAGRVSAHPGPAAAWMAVFILSLMYALAFVDRQIISLLVAPIKHDLHVTNVQISLLQGFSFALLYSTCGLPLGLAADRFPRRWVIFFGVTIWALAATACGLAQTFPQLLAARFLVGMGEAALAPAAYSILSDLFPKTRLTFALSIYSIGALAGSALSLALGATVIQWFANGTTLPVIGHVASWQAAFLVTGAPGLLIALLIFTIPEPARGTDGRGIGGDWRELGAFLRSRWAFLTCHVVGFATVMTMAYANLGWAPTFVMQAYRWPVTQVGMVMALFGFVTGVASMTFSGRVVDIMVKRGIDDAHFRFYLVATAIICLCGAAAFQSPSAWGYFMLYAPCGIGLNMSAIGASGIQIVTPPALRGRVSAGYLMIVALTAMTLGPAVPALFTDHVFHSDAKIGWSLTATYLIFAPLAFLAFFLGLGPMRRAVTRARAEGIS